VFSFNNKRSKGFLSKPTIKTTIQKQESGHHIKKSDDVDLRFVCLIPLLIMTALLVHSIVGNLPVAQVGDMLEFNLDTVSVTAPITAVPARIVGDPWAAPGRVCTLDVSTMTKHGGVIAVTAVRHDGVMLDWAGGATALGQADCGNDEQILVKDTDYEHLRMAQAPRPRNPR
jgi:hypothetical protein